MSNNKAGPFKLLLVINAIPLLALAGIGIAVWEGRLGIAIPKEGLVIIGLLLALGTVSAILGFFAAPAVDSARDRNRKARARIAARLASPQCGFGERVGLWLRRLLNAFAALLLAIESAGIYGALIVTVLAITGVGAFGAYVAYLMATGQAVPGGS